MHQKYSYSDFSNVGCLQSFWPLDHFEFNIIPFLQGFEAFAGYSGKMTKNIFATFLFKKTKPFCIIKPFYFSSYHYVPSPECLFYPKQSWILFHFSNFTLIVNPQTTFHLRVDFL